MVAMAFAPQIQTDCDARNLDFDDFFYLLGHKTKGNALRTLTTTIPEAEIIIIKSDKNSVGRPRDVYMISVNQFEEVLLAANTDTGKKWRKVVLRIKNLVVQYMKMELEATAKRAQEQMSQLVIKEEETAPKSAIAEQEYTTLVTQLKRLREAKSYLYAFWLFDDRYKCGVTDNPEKCEKQHRTSCPSGRMVHTIVIACKQSEKLMDSIMKRHGNHVRQEEYQIEGGEERVKLVLVTVARIEESLHIVPFDRYNEVLSFANSLLDVRNAVGPVAARVQIEREMESEMVNGDVLDTLDEWLINHLRNDTLPSRILSSQVAKQLSRCDNEISPKWVTTKMQIHDNRGVVIPENKITIEEGPYKGRGRGFRFEVPFFLETMIRKGWMVAQ